MNTTERDCAIHQLRERLPRGTVIYSILRSNSASGLTHWIDLYHVSDNTPLRITWSVSQATGAHYSDKHEALRKTGGGIDAGHDAVHHLARVLHGDDYAFQHKRL